MNPTLKIVLLSNSVQVFAATLFIPVFALFINDLGGGPKLAGILFGISFFVMAVGNLLVARMSDTALRSLLFYKIGLLAKIAAWVLLALSQTIPALIIAQVILGISTAVGAPGFHSLISGNLDHQKHISSWAKWDFMQNVATAGASVLSGFIVAQFGFDNLFWIMALITTLSFVYSTKITKRVSSTRA